MRMVPWTNMVARTLQVLPSECYRAIGAAYKEAATDRDPPWEASRSAVVTPMWPASSQKPCFYLACAVTDAAFISTTYEEEARALSVWIRRRFRVNTVDLDGERVLRHLQQAMERYSNFPLELSLHTCDPEPMKPSEQRGRLKGKGRGRGRGGEQKGKGPEGKGQGKAKGSRQPERAEDQPAEGRPEPPQFDAWLGAAQQAHRGQAKGRGRGWT